MNLDALIGTRPGTASTAAGGLIAATIATTPAGRENVDVLIAGNQRTGPCVWSPVVIDGALFTPTRDDPCFVSQARRGEMVVVWWEPGDDREGVALDTAPAPESLAQPGDVKWTARTTAPGGWLACDGTMLDPSDEPDLFDAIGTTYGGNGVTTFNLPDMRGRVPVGAGAGAGLTTRAPGQAFGAEAHVLTTAQVPSHTHTPQPGRINSTGFGTGGYARDNGTGATNDFPIGNTGGDGSHPNVQPSLCLLAIIKS